MDARGDRIHTLPYLTGDLPGTGGRIRARPEDFQVREIPLYEINESGPHLYFEVKKRGLSTRRALEIIARQLDEPVRQFGYAGRKDADAVTTQRVSLEHAEPEDLRAVEHPDLDVNVLGYHRNKLRTGHLEANHFTVILRDVHEPAYHRAEQILGKLQDDGVPNYFGSQRFGRRGDTAQLGECMVRNNLEEFVHRYLGHPREDDPPPCREARAAFESGDYERALDRWPSSNRSEKRALATYRDRGSPKPVLAALPRGLRRLFASAYQSRLFNEVLARRMPDIHRVREGDWAKKHDTGGVFLVEDAEREQDRARKFAISPTGPLFGVDSRVAEKEPGQRERNVLEEEGLELSDFEVVEYLGLSGDRRFLRTPLSEVQITEKTRDGRPALRLEFRLASSSYATVVLREVMKTIES